MRLFSLILVLSVFLGAAAFSAEIPECLDRDGNLLEIDNDQVIEWKASSPNQYTAMAHVIGRVTRTFLERNSHVHFEIDLASEEEQNDLNFSRGELRGISHTTLEVVYNKAFGEMPNIVEGMVVEACGEYITSFKKTGSYQASPAAAIIHYVHRSTNSHPSGFLVMDDELVGQRNPGDRRNR